MKSDCDFDFRKIVNGKSGRSDDFTHNYRPTLVNLLRLHKNTYLCTIKFSLLLTFKYAFNDVTLREDYEFLLTLRRECARLAEGTNILEGQQ